MQCFLERNNFLNVLGQKSIIVRSYYFSDVKSILMCYLMLRHFCFILFNSLEKLLLCGQLLPLGEFLSVLGKTNNARCFQLLNLFKNLKIVFVSDGVCELPEIEN